MARTSFSPRPTPPEPRTKNQEPSRKHYLFSFSLFFLAKKDLIPVRLGASRGNFALEADNSHDRVWISSRTTEPAKDEPVPNQQLYSLCGQQRRSQRDSELGANALPGL